MKRIIALLSILAFTACAQPGQSQYGYQDVGHATVVQYGVVESSRVVGITGQNTGLGAGAGAMGGAIGGSYVGHGGGSLGGMLVGALIGGVIGHMGEQAMSDRHGIEYTVDLDNGVTVTIVQEIHKEDLQLKHGQRCMVQTSGMYQRVLPSDKPRKRHKIAQSLD